MKFWGIGGNDGQCVGESIVDTKGLISLITQSFLRQIRLAGGLFRFLLKNRILFRKPQRAPVHGLGQQTRPVRNEDFPSVRRQNGTHEVSHRRG
jgi:hypothetical protein